MSDESTSANSSPEPDQPKPQVSEPPPQEPACRHEYVTIYQRKLKGLDRRLVGTPAFLPVGFKMVDFKHLSPGSFCFCRTCRKRLFPKRTQAEKLQAKLERKRIKELEIEKMKQQAGDLAVAINPELKPNEDIDEDDGLSGLANAKSAMPFGLSKKPVVQDLDDDDDDDEEDDGTIEDADLDNAEVDENADIHVEELEVESVDVLDIKAEGVKISTEDDLDGSCEDGDDDS